MLDKLIAWDEELFLFLNSKHVTWLDHVMVFLSSYYCWILVAVSMLAFIYIKSKSWRKVTSLFFILTIGASGAITNIIKLIIERPRPIHKPEWNGLIYALEGITDSSYSFFSSHSATTFSMSVFFFLVMRKLQLSHAHIYGYIAILWAAAVAYSRIYVAKHYPLDVFCGILFGVIVGVLGFQLLEYYLKNKSVKIN